MAKHRPFTLIFPYYENPIQLHRQYANLAALPEEYRRCIHLVVCDDGSPISPASLPPGFSCRRPVREGEPVAGFKTYEATGPVTVDSNGLGIASLQLFRIDVDVRWNWLACRNIGAKHAKTEWMLLTDIDHEVPGSTASRIIGGKLKADCVYRFSRRDAPDLTPYKPHPNSWLMTKAMYDAVGGYDERFSGFYGTDSEFRDRIRANARKIVLLEEYLVRVPREVVPDASTTTYLRKQPEDREGVSRVRAEIARDGGPPKRLSFPYHRVAPC